MLYELFLTDMCNRSCDFCYVKQGSYRMSIKEVEQAMGGKVRHLTGGVPYILSLFGGEPFLNEAALVRAVELGNKDPKCTEVQIHTNGDVLMCRPELVWLFAELPVHFVVSCYEDISMYKEMVEAIKNFTMPTIDHKVTLTRTITKHNVNSIDSFILGGWKLGCRPKLSISHDVESWKDFDVYDFWKKETIAELEAGAERARTNNYFVYSPIDNYVRRMLQSSIGQGKECSCLDERVTIYKGKTLPCIRFNSFLFKKDPKPRPRSCLGCEYLKTCNASCRALWGREEIPKELCLINKAIFHGIEEVAKTHIQDAGWQNLIAYYLQESQKE